MNPIGEYVIVAGEVLDGGRIKVMLHKKEESGVSKMEVILPPGSVVRIGDAVTLTTFGYVHD